MRLAITLTFVAALSVCSSVGAQDLTSDQLMTLSESSSGRGKIFRYLRTVSKSWTKWPINDEVHLRMTDGYLKIASNPEAAELDRVVALRGLHSASMSAEGITEDQKPQLDELTSKLLEESNPMDVRLSALLFRRKPNALQVYGAKKHERVFLMEALKNCQYEHLRSLCVSRLLSGSHLVKDVTQYQSEADALIAIARDPRDRLSCQAIENLTDVASLAGELVPALVQQYDQYDCQREVVEFLGKSGASHDLSLPLFWTVFSEQGELYEKEATLIAISNIIGANDLDASRANEAVAEVMKMDDWLPRYATPEICENLGTKASPLIDPLLQWVETTDDVLPQDLASTAKCFAFMGKDAKDGATKLSKQIDKIQEDQVGEFLQDLARAGMGNTLVPLAMKHIDDPYTQNGAIRCLAIIGPEADSCVPKLIKLIDNRDTKREAITALAQMGERGKEASGKLKSLAKSGDDSAAMGLILMFPDDEDTVRIAYRAKLSFLPSEIDELSAKLSKPQLDSLRATVASELNGDHSELALQNVAIKITNASFGIKDRQTDVTEILQRMIENRFPYLRPSSEGLGVKDPAAGSDKKIKINYRIGGKEYSKSIPCGLKRPPVNLRTTLIPGDFVPVYAISEMPKGVPSAKEIKEYSWRLDPHLTIGVPREDFKWTVTSTEPAVYECRSEKSPIRIRISPKEAINDFAAVREKALTDYQRKVTSELKDSGAVFANGSDYFIHYSDDSVRGMQALMFDYEIEGQKYGHLIGRLFRQLGSYQIEISAPAGVVEQLAPLFRFMQLDIDKLAGND